MGCRVMVVMVMVLPVCVSAGRRLSTPVEAECCAARRRKAEAKAARQSRGLCDTPSAPRPASFRRSVEVQHLA